MSTGNWCLIESDPAVFTELISQLGVAGVQVEEVFDITSLEGSDANIYGFVFLFRYEGATTLPPDVSVAPDDGTVFFAKQIIQNACATQAILSILMNADIELGPMLTEFRDFTSMLDAETRGLAITNSEQMRHVHNAFAGSDPFVNEGSSNDPEDAEELFHFVSYLYRNGAVWELDGLRSGPINHGPATPTTWISQLSTILQRRMSAQPTNIKFSLQVLRRKPLDILTEKLRAGAESMTDVERRDIETDVEVEKEKLERWGRENGRRRHNFLGFTLELLNQMAKAGVTLIPEKSEKKS
ncbi:Ubiquitin carboxyl-terminal hydrolase bap1 [Gonapodya sp. JEL0774]|nr:Ubiquitin carboxyl-terminal hydrolase bap1 [Gonapodya sp. JEL0774]